MNPLFVTKLGWAAGVFNFSSFWIAELMSCSYSVGGGSYFGAPTGPTAVPEPAEPGALMDMNRISGVFSGSV